MLAWSLSDTTLISGLEHIVASLTSSMLLYIISSNSKDQRGVSERLDAMHEMSSEAVKINPLTADPVKALRFVILV